MAARGSGRALRSLLSGKTPEELCRLCLRDTKSASICLSHVTITRRGETTVGDLLERVAPKLPTELTDLLSDKVCQSCYKKANAAYNFQLDCEDSAMALQQNITELHTILTKMPLDSDPKCMMIFLKDREGAHNSVFKNTFVRRYVLARNKNKLIESDTEAVEATIQTEVKAEITVEEDDDETYGMKKQKNVLRLGSRKKKETILNKEKTDLENYKSDDDFNTSKDLTLESIKKKSKGTILLSQKTVAPESKDYVFFFDNYGNTSVFCYSDGDQTNLIKLDQVRGVKKMYGNCTMCQLPCYTVRDMFKHMNLIHGILFCVECKMALTHELDFEEHLREHDTYACDRCDRVYKNRNLFVEHLMEHDDNQIVLDTDKYRNSKTHCRMKCNHCSKLLDSISAYHKHLEAKHPGEPAYKCPACHELSHNYFAFKEHKRTHSRFDCMYSECTECGSLCRTWDDLFAHMRCDHGIYLCKECEEQLGTLEEYREHSRTHEQFICDNCGMAFKMRSVFVQHLRKHDREYSCEHCDESCISGRRALLRHLRAAHPDAAPYLCHLCPETFRLRASLLSHQRRHARTDVNKDMVVQCTDCDQVCGNIKQMVRHLKETHNTYVCLECELRLPSLAEMREHNRLLHARYACEFCERMFTNRGTLYSHLRQLHRDTYSTLSGRLNKLDVKCDYCDERFNDKLSCTKHRIKAHRNVRPFPCTICPKSFRTKTQCNEHIKAHEKRRPFKCDQCDGVFVTARARLRHQLALHTNERPYVCDVCGRAFATLDRHNAHVKRLHGERKAACEHCHTKFASQGDLNQHVKKVHMKHLKPPRPRRARNSPARPEESHMYSPVEAAPALVVSHLTLTGHSPLLIGNFD